MVLVQNWPFFHLFIFRNIGQEKSVFYDILERKNTFLGYKNKKIKTWKNWDFSKGVCPWFLAKNGHFLFHWWYLGKSSQERSSFEILDTKEGLLDKKSQVLQKSKKLKFLVRLVIHSFIHLFIYSLFGKAG